MKPVSIKTRLFAVFPFVLTLVVAALGLSSLPKTTQADDRALMEEPASSSSNGSSSTLDAVNSENSEPKGGVMESKEASESVSGLEELKSKETASPKKTDSKRAGTHAEAFVAPPDWEFDGFIAGGRDENVKSMFAVHDLVYLSVGHGQGFTSGDRLDVFRRGEKIKDPQTGRNLGYEVRKMAVIEITDRIDNNSSSARVIRAYEPVEIGDLVKRGE